MNTAQWDTISWDLLKIEYELLGKSLITISRETSIPLNYLKEYVKDEGWEQSTQVKELLNLTDITNAADSFIEDVSLKLEKLTLMRQELFAPHYLKFELQLIAKASNIISKLEDDDPSAHTKMKAMAQVFKDLMSANGRLTSAKDEVKNTGDHIQVVFQKTENIVENKAAIQVPTKKLSN